MLSTDGCQQGCIFHAFEIFSVLAVYKSTFKTCIIVIHTKTLFIACLTCSRCHKVVHPRRNKLVSVEKHRREYYNAHKNRSILRTVCCVYASMKHKEYVFKLIMMHCEVAKIKQKNHISTAKSRPI